MKRLAIIFVALSIFFSCQEIDDQRGQGGQNPLSECVLPSTVQAGEEALVQWNGFQKHAKISLVAEGGQEYDIPVKVVTDSGIMFVVPAGLPAGEYIVVLEQEGRKELGKIQVAAADMPITGLALPSGLAIGEMLLIEGIGFEEGCSIVLVDDAGNEYTAAASLVPSGVTVEFPSDIVKGNYEIYFIQDGASWLIAPSFTVYGGSGIKGLTRLDYYTPYVGTALLRLSWEISREEPVTMTLSEYLVEGAEVTLQAYDQYICNAAGTFELKHDGFESSNDMKTTYLRDAEGSVTGSDVLIYGKSKATAFTWTYDADGYLTDISSSSGSFRSLDYTDGNLTMFRNSGFEYGDPALVNHPSAPDVVWAYMALMETNDPFVYFPYLLGWYRKASAHLPVAMKLPSPTGTGTVRNPLTYTFDEEGYVVNMAWGSSEICFIYE